MHKTKTKAWTRAAKRVRSKPDPFERRCRSCGVLCRAESSREVRLCAPCARKRPGYEQRIRHLLDYAKLPKRRNVVRLQLSHNGNDADLYHVVIPRHLIETLGWAKGERL